MTQIEFTVELAPADPSNAWDREKLKVAASASFEVDPVVTVGDKKFLLSDLTALTATLRAFFGYTSV